MPKFKSSLCHKIPQGTESEVWIPLIPVGAFAGKDKRSWNNKNPEDVIVNTDLPIALDIDHRSELTMDTAACGWITELKLENNQIYGKLELNNIGQEKIQNKHYKFYSPAFLHTQDGVVVELISVGLTNKPNLNVPALNSVDEDYQQPQQESNAMDEIAKLLGLDETADKDTIIQAIKTLQEKSAQEASLNSAIPRATYDQTVAALNSAKAELAQIKQDEHKKAVEVAINTAIKEKKIAPADKEYFAKTCETPEGLTAFNSFVSNKAPIVGEVKLPSEPTTTKTALNAEAKAIFEQFGYSEQDLQGDK
ncbi:MAG: hypothetical protein KGV50_02570 [Gammaproteobacteria bacterium]|nr:hypothetical protein [Gammaproteobacteria bacterium]